MPNGDVMNCFEIAKFISEIVLTVVAISISIIALFQTKTQIKLSNKQLLFDRRLEKYTIIESVLSEYNCIDFLEIDYSNKDDLDAFAKIVLESLFDCIILKDAQWTIDKLTDLTDRDISNVFLSQCSKLSVLSKEITIIFNNEESKIVSKFINYYEMLILNFYHYIRFINDGSKEEDNCIKRIDKINNELKILYKNIEDNDIMNLLLTETKL